MSLLTRLSLANRMVIALMTLLVVGVGLFATTSLKQEMIPSLGHQLNQEPGLLEEVEKATDAALQLG